MKESAGPTGGAPKKLVGSEFRNPSLDVRGEVLRTDSVVDSPNIVLSDESIALTLVSFLRSRWATRRLRAASFPSSSTSPSRGAPHGGGSPIFHRFRFPRLGPRTAVSANCGWSGRGRSPVTSGGFPFHFPPRDPPCDGSLGRAPDPFRSPSIGSLALGPILTCLSPAFQARSCCPSFGKALDRPSGIARSPLIGSLAWVSVVARFPSGLLAWSGWCARFSFVESLAALFARSPLIESLAW